MASIPSALHFSRLHYPLPLIQIRCPNHSVLLNPLFCAFSRSFRRPTRPIRVSGDPFFDSSDDKSTEDRARIEVKGKNSVLNSVFSSFRATINSMPASVLLMKRNIGDKYQVGLCVAFVAVVVIALRQIVVANHSRVQGGSVADLVRRGQLRSNRRGISKPLRYDDPFNNPFVKVGKSESTVEMFGKFYRMEPVTLTKEQQSSHQKRRSQTYQWKRPTIFLKEGDDIPPDVDPDRIRWIPANHPFATTVSDIDENVARENVYQKHGAPFRIRVEHEALQKKLEALQKRQGLNIGATDPLSNHDSEEPFKWPSEPQEQQEHSSSINQHHGHSISELDQSMATPDNSSDNKNTSQ